MMATMRLMNISVTSHTYHAFMSGENASDLPFQQISSIRYSIINHGHHAVLSIPRIHSSSN